MSASEDEPVRLRRCWGHWSWKQVLSAPGSLSGWGAASKSALWTQGVLLTAVLVLPATPQLRVASEQRSPSSPAGLRGQGPHKAGVGMGVPGPPP